MKTAFWLEVFNVVRNHPLATLLFTLIFVLAVYLGVRMVVRRARVSIHRDWQRGREELSVAQNRFNERFGRKSTDTPDSLHEDFSRKKA